MKNSNFIPYLALFCVCFFWGTTFMGIRVGVEHLPPFVLAGGRQTIAGILLCFYMVIKKEQIPPLKTLWPVALSGLMMIALGNGLVTWSEQFVPSGLAALVCATSPFWIIGINLIIGKGEKISKMTWIGLIIGLIGQVFICLDNLKDLLIGNFGLGILLISIANIGWSAGTILTKEKKVQINPLYSAGLQMLIAGIALDILAAMHGDWAKAEYTTEGLAAMLYLAVFGSAIAYGAYVYVIGKLPMTIVSIYAYINPIVAVILGALFMDEKLTSNIVISVILTLFGVYWVNKGVKKAG